MKKSPISQCKNMFLMIDNVKISAITYLIHTMATIDNKDNVLCVEFLDCPYNQ